VENKKHDKLPTYNFPYSVSPGPSSVPEGQLSGSYQKHPRPNRTKAPPSCRSNWDFLGVINKTLEQEPGITSWKCRESFQTNAATTRWNLIRSCSDWIYPPLESCSAHCTAAAVAEGKDCW